MSEYVSQCGCKIHVAQWTSKRKLVSVKYCDKHSGKGSEAAVLSERERCANISQEWYKERDRPDFTQEQWVSRGTVADEIAARIRSGE